MSWQAHIDNMMSHQQNEGHCAICGVNDGGIWAASPGCPLTQAEAANLASFVRANGVGGDKQYTFGGIALMIVRNYEDGGVTYYQLVTKNSDARQIRDDEKGLVAVAKSAQALVIGYVPGANQKKANASVEYEVKYLLSQGY